MTDFKNILVDIDALADAHPAMDRAVELARACGASLTVVDVIAVPADARAYLPQRVEDRLVGERRARLEALVETVPGVNVRCEVLTGRPSVALLQEVRRSGHDLLIRAHARDLVAPRPFGAIDMQLFRQCPCPVWAVGPAATTAPRRVLAAVHAADDDAEEEAFNRKIIDTALVMTRLEGGELVIFQAWTAFGEELLRSHSKPHEVRAYVKAAENAARGALGRLVASFGDRLASARVELNQGEAETLIPSIVVSQGIDLVVMGTVARTGIAGLVIGNTAERLLQRLVCSVLAVKPDGFETPVRPQS